MNTTLEIRAPAEQTEGTRSQVLRWLKAIGDEIVEHEPLIEIETDKVTVEVAAPASGVLREIVKGEQEEIAPGEVLGRLELDSARIAQVSPEGAAAGAAPDLQYVSPTAGASLSTEASSHACAPLRDTAESAGVFSPGDEARPAGRGDTAAPVRLSPAVRRLLSERGLDPSVMRGSGEGGRITVDDVLAASNEPRSSDDAGSVRSADTGPVKPHATARPATSGPAPSAPSTDVRLPSHSVPHSAIRKRIAEHMVQSLLHTAPHVTTVFEADMSAVIAHRASRRMDFEARGVPLTFTAYFLSAAVAAIRSVPEANSRWTDSALEIYDTVNIGIATALENGGLVVPVLRGVESQDLFEVARGLDDLVTAARAGKLQPADVRGGTFTISNHGVSGSLLAAPIVINQPQSAILGIGKLEKRLTVAEQGGAEQVIVRPKCYVTLTIDHRVMDGHQANRFLQTFVKVLETWPAQ